MNMLQKNEALTKANTELKTFTKMDSKDENFNKELKEVLVDIGKVFGLSEEDFEKNKVTRENLFNNDEVWNFN